MILAAYVAHLLFSRLGLRNIEIVNARTHWISDGSIGIINRAEEDFFPKGCEGWVPIAPDVLKEVLSFQPLCTDGYLVPGANRTERHEAVYRRHQNGFPSGLRIGQKPATNCVVTLVRGCSTWVPQFSRCAISSGIATCKRRKCGMPTGFKIGSSDDRDG